MAHLECAAYKKIYYDTIYGSIIFAQFKKYGFIKRGKIAIKHN